MNLFDEVKILTEVSFRTSRSSGPGGQSVNKVSTKVELVFNLWDSLALSQSQKEVIAVSLSNRINSDGILQLSSDETRSQLKNKSLVISRFIQLLLVALKPKKKRIPTKRSNSSIQKRLRNKKIISDKKKNRKVME